MAEPEATGFLFERDWTNPNTGGTLRCTIDPDFKVRLVATGKGTMEGAHAFVRILNEAIEELGRDYRVEAKVDLRQLYSSPVRAQFVLGKWLFANKALIDNVAIFGGKPWEMRLARVVMKIARMKRVGFFDTEAQAIAYLGWPGP